MAINQRDVFLLKLEDVPDHPCIVVSSSASNDFEGSFLAVLITSNGANDTMTFPLFDQMFETPLPKKNSQARCHMMFLNREKHIIGNKSVPLNRMKEAPFNELMKQIGECVFNFNIEPKQ